MVFLSEEDWTRLYAIFVQMNGNQKNEQMISFWGPSPYSDRAFSPPQRFYDIWIENPKCNIRIDGEKDDNKPTHLYLDPEPRYGWRMSKVTKIENGMVYSTGSDNVSSPSAFHPK